MPSSILRATLALSLLSGSGAAYAEICKWVDEDGNIHFGDKPGGNTGAEQIEIRESSPGNNDPALKQRREDRKKLLRVMEEERREREEKQRQAREQAREEKATRKRNCAKARDYKRSIDAAGPIYNLDEEGNRVYLSEEESKAERQRAVELVREWCG